MRWELEPGHSAAEFCCRHMMVTWVRGHIKNVRGTLDFDEKRPEKASVRVEMDAAALWTDEKDRDAHLKSADFLDAEKHRKILFSSTRVEVQAPHEYGVHGDLTIRGVTRPVVLKTQYLGCWETPFWEGGVDKGPMIRAGFTATASINRHDFGVSWNAPLEMGGVVVGDEVFITLDIEAIRKKAQ
jgi:polyisoprenoid-binding protein YceI